VEEVRALLAKYAALSRTAIQAVGYREVVEELGEKMSEVGGQMSEGDWTACVERVKARTRQFARRQETWFRSLSECQAVPMREGFEPANVAEEILSAAKVA
jgi:tRNA dimethylallyltransferase